MYYFQGPFKTKVKRQEHLLATNHPRPIELLKDDDATIATKVKNCSTPILKIEDWTPVICFTSWICLMAAEDDLLSLSYKCAVKTAFFGMKLVLIFAV